MISIEDRAELRNNVRKKTQLAQLQALGLVGVLGEEIPQTTFDFETSDHNDILLEASKAGKAIPRRKKKVYQTLEQEREGAKCYKLASDFMAKNKKYALEVLHTYFLSQYARHSKKNHIILLPEDRKARHRAHKKLQGPTGNQNRCYKLKTHSEKRGYHKQAWVIGLPSREEEDHKKSFIEGPEQFYLPAEVVWLGYEIIKELHYTFSYFFESCPDKKKAKGRLMASVDKLLAKRKIPHVYSSNQLRATLHSMFTWGIDAHAKNLGFGRGRGRPKKVNNLQLVLPAARTREGTKKINEELKRVSRETGIILKDRETARLLKAKAFKRIGRWTIKGTTMREIKLREEAGERLKSMQLLDLALGEVGALFSVELKELRKVHPDAVWVRGERKPHFAQSENNWPPYSKRNKYNVSKERYDKRRGHLNL